MNMIANAEFNVLVRDEGIGGRGGFQGFVEKPMEGVANAWYRVKNRAINVFRSNIE